MQVAISSEPPGAVVLASPLDEPVAYKKGITPCDVTLDDACGPHMLILSKTGYFPCYRTAAPGALHVVLPSRDDPASWQALRGSSGVPSPYELLPVTWTDHEAVAGIRTEHRTWAPDASGTLVNASPYGEQAVALGLAKPGQEKECSELWWMPWGGAPVLLWRYVTRSPYEGFPYWPDATFSPDPRWLVHSAPVGPRERLELHCLATGRKTTIAGDPDATLCCAVFSPDGRWIACVRGPIDSEARYQRPPQELDDVPQPPPPDPLRMVSSPPHGVTARPFAATIGITGGDGGRRTAPVPIPGDCCDELSPTVPAEEVVK